MEPGAERAAPRMTVGELIVIKPQHLSQGSTFSSHNRHNTTVCCRADCGEQHESTLDKHFTRRCDAGDDSDRPPRRWGWIAVRWTPSQIVGDLAEIGRSAVVDGVRACADDGLGGRHRSSHRRSRRTRRDGAEHRSAVSNHIAAGRGEAGATDRIRTQPRMVNGSGDVTAGRAAGRSTPRCLRNRGRPRGSTSDHGRSLAGRRHRVGAHRHGDVRWPSRESCSA